MKKRKYVVILLLCIGVMWICAASGAVVNAGSAVHPPGARLVRFDLHKSTNREVGVPAGIPGYFTYYYEGKEYHYGFRFDRGGTAAESRSFGTAYVWAPCSVIHYDAAGGKITDYGTAVPGNQDLTAARGDGQLLEKGDFEKHTRRYATDYTVYGNSLRLSEGRMPQARRKGYVFQGWYAYTENGEVQTEEVEALAEEGKFGRIWKLVNTRFDEETKILKRPEDKKTPAKEITLYALWEEAKGDVSQ